MNTLYTCYPGGKHKALSLSYDDGNVADRTMVHMLNVGEIKGTFHLNSGQLDGEHRVKTDEVASLYEGHEIACHTATHPTLTRCPDHEIIAQILEDRRALEELAGYTVRGLSYPNGAWNVGIRDLLPRLGLSWARTVDTTGHFHHGEEPFAMKTSCHHNDNLLERAREFISLTKGQYLYWFTVWGHSWEFDRDDNWQLLEDFVSLCGNRSDLWYTTCTGMWDYLDAAKRMRYSADSRFVENPSGLPVCISFNGVIHHIPPGDRIRLV